MPLNQVQRIKLAEHFYAVGPRKLTTNPQVRDMVDAYVASGNVNAIANEKLRTMIQRLEDLQLDEMTPQQIDATVRDGLATVLGMVVRDPDSKDFMRDFIGNAPLTQDQDTLNDYVTTSVMGHMQSQLDAQSAHQFQMSWGTMQQTMTDMGLSMNDMDFDDPAFQTAYFTNTIQRQYPHLTPAETRRAVDEYRAIAQEMNWFGTNRRSLIPEGCVLPLTFLAVIAFLYGVMGLLLLAILGTVALPAFWQTEVGQALNATLFLIGIIGGLYTWLRRTGMRGGLLRLILGGVLIASVGLLVVQLISLDTDALAETATTDVDQTLAMGVFGLSILLSGFLWLRARTLNLLTGGILLVLIVVMVTLAQQNGILDLTDINLDFLSDTTEDTIGFE